MAARKRIALENDGQAILATFLKDQIRAGLPALLEKGPQELEQAARRMTDAQLKGVAVRLKKFAMQPFENTDAWYQSALALFAELFLLESAMRHPDRLPESVRQDIGTLMGRTITKKQLMAQADADLAQDVWCAAATFEWSEPDHIRGRKQWLYGLYTGRTAFILDYAHERMDLPPLACPPATLTPGVLVFYPASFPQRALLMPEVQPAVPRTPLHPPLAHWAAVQEQYAIALSQYPWLEQMLCHVAGLTLFSHEKNWYLADAAGKMMPLTAPVAERTIWQMLAITGGHPVPCLLLYTHASVVPLGILQGQQYLPFT